MENLCTCFGTIGIFSLSLLILECDLSPFILIFACFQQHCVVSSTWVLFMFDWFSHECLIVFSGCRWCVYMYLYMYTSPAFQADSYLWDTREAQKKSHCREIFSRMERCSAISLSSLILNQSMKLAKYFMLVTASWACKMHHFLYHIKAYGLNSKNWFISKEADCFLLDQQ